MNFDQTRFGLLSDTAETLGFTTGDSLRIGNAEPIPFSSMSSIDPTALALWPFSGIGVNDLLGLVGSDIEIPKSGSRPPVSWISISALKPFSIWMAASWITT